MRDREFEDRLDEIQNRAKACNAVMEIILFLVIALFIYEAVR